jgi:hypothetical protein
LALLREPHKCGARAHRDEMLVSQIEHVWHVNMQVYGADKVCGNWHARALSQLVARSSD